MIKTEFCFSEDNCEVTMTLPDCVLIFYFERSDNLFISNFFNKFEGRTVTQRSKVFFKTVCDVSKVKKEPEIGMIIEEAIFETYSKSILEGDISKTSEKLQGLLAVQKEMRNKFYKIK